MTHLLSGLQRRALAIAFSILFVTLLASSFVAAQQPSAGYRPVTTYDPKRDGVKDINAALAEARRTHRRVILDVGGTWCVWCKYLDTFFDQHPDVKKLRDANYIIVKINVSEENKNEAALKRFGEIEGYPHLIVLDESGKLLTSHKTNDLEEGKGYSIRAVTDFLNKYAPKK